MTTTRTATAEDARGLLRRLRDLNAIACGIAVGPAERISYGGCLSLDAPVENGVRYRLITGAGERTLELAWRSDKLEVVLTGGADPEPARSLRVDLACDPEGRLVSRALGARLDPDDTDGRTLEHFLRRVVRAVYAAPRNARRA